VGPLQDGGAGLQIRPAVKKFETAVTNSRKGAVLLLVGWTGDQQLLTLKNQHVTKYYTKPRA